MIDRVSARIDLRPEAFPGEKRLLKRLDESGAYSLLLGLKSEVYPQCRVEVIPLRRDGEVEAFDYMGVALRANVNANVNINVELRAYRGGIRRRDVMRLVVGNDEDNWLRRGQWSNRGFMEELMLVRLFDRGLLPPDIVNKSRIANSGLRSKHFSFSDL